jgi:hypothetical protein
MSGGRKALLIGINYVGSSNALQVRNLISFVAQCSPSMSAVDSMFDAPCSVGRSRMMDPSANPLIVSQGCHQDVRNMKEFLMSQGWSDGDMVVLTDESFVNPHSPGYPTGQNILRAMRWLIDRSDNCSLFLHYSGHGGQVQDHSVLTLPMKIAFVLISCSGGQGIDDTVSHA